MAHFAWPHHELFAVYCCGLLGSENHQTRRLHCFCCAIAADGSVSGYVAISRYANAASHHRGVYVVYEYTGASYHAVVGRGDYATHYSQHRYCAG